MTEYTGKRTSKTTALAIVVIIMIIAAIAITFFQKRSGDRSAMSTGNKAGTTADQAAPIDQQKVIDYEALDKESALSKEMDDRKEKYGLEDSVDMVAKADEAVRVGDHTVSMETIQEQSALGKGRVVETDLPGGLSVNPENTTEYGIHVVQPGENIWDIHFQLLKDYFEEKDVSLSPLADEPAKNGTSSGIGKILKFSENSVIIYNLNKNKIEIDLDIIHPLEKIVVYQMDELFSLLDRIDYKNIRKLEFDGKTLWMPADTQKAATD
ncbi:MAG: hypothetical protein SWH61_03605 [Thermodesulfobacteriota bacterium]|nr:hypothetical protein [Thermodesulfobacteriota bacterium]